jgi:hypothetical protein
MDAEDVVEAFEKNEEYQDLLLFVDGLVGLSGEGAL